jgi:hypothetical protein
MVKHEFKMTNPQTIENFHKKFYANILQTRLNLYNRILERVKLKTWDNDYWIEAKNKMELDYPNIAQGDAISPEDKQNGW